jgi:hypothetical protein
MLFLAAVGTDPQYRVSDALSYGSCHGRADFTVFCICSHVVEGADYIHACLMTHDRVSLAEGHATERACRLRLIKAVILRGQVI